MNQFTFDNRQKTLFGAMMLIGIISMVITWMGDDAYHTRFWSNLLHNFVFFTGTALMALFMLSASITAWAGWYTVIKRVWEAYSLFLIVGLGLDAHYCSRNLGWMASSLSLGRYESGCRG
jgi:hypothetical protein